MFKYNCLNPIAKVGLDNFDANYEMTDDPSFLSSGIKSSFFLSSFIALSFGFKNAVIFPCEP